MDFELEINNLAAEALALQSLMVAILSQFGNRSPADQMLLTRAFDAAERYIKDHADRDARVGRPEQIDKAIRMVEELRTATLRR